MHQSLFSFGRSSLSIFSKITLAITFLYGLSGCGPNKEGKFTPLLLEVAHSANQWTGIAITSDARMFVNYPRWSDDVNGSVAEITKTGLAFYPDNDWNFWDSTANPKEHFICVQSVVVDKGDFLWILDAASPKMKGVIKDGAKLIKVDPESNNVVQKVYFDETIAKKNSYLNDVRVDAGLAYAYITDSGDGALIVVNLTTGKSRRVLDNHPSTHSEKIPIVIDGKQWKRPDGSLGSADADGIALDSTGQFLYYQALTGVTLYRIETKWLRDETLSEQQLGEKVEKVATSGPADGLMFDPKGNLYLSGLQEKAIKRLLPDQKIDTLVQSPELDWPDSFTVGPDGFMYLTTSQIHLGPKPANPYRIYKVRMSK